jgi:hypothetical protein
MFLCRSQRHDLGVSHLAPFLPHGGQHSFFVKLILVGQCMEGRIERNAGA